MANTAHCIVQTSDEDATAWCIGDTGTVRSDRQQPEYSMWIGMH